MFDYVNHQPTPQDPRRPRYMTAGVSAIMHVLVVGVAVGLPILYASDELPPPPDMMAFVMDAPVPPPPPPAPAPPPPARKPEMAKPTRPALETATPAPAAGAPIEAPAAVTPESGLESQATAAKVEAGFESGIAGGVVGGAVGGIETGALPPPPPPKPVPQGPVRVGGQIKAPELVHRVNPKYPPAAQGAQVQGSVVLEATVDKAGRVQSVRVVRSQPLLDDAAIAAVRQWRYEPLNLNGQPMPFILTVTVSFTIPT